MLMLVVAGSFKRRFLIQKKHFNHWSSDQTGMINSFHSLSFPPPPHRPGVLSGPPTDQPHPPYHYTPTPTPTITTPPLHTDPYHHTPTTYQPAGHCASARCPGAGLAQLDHRGSGRGGGLAQPDLREVSAWRRTTDPGCDEESRVL